MPRDSRLYMTFPIDFHRHPKVRGLSDSAFRAFVESNGEARIAENDGHFEVDDAEFLWSAESLAELVASHPSRPLMIRDESGYVIRDYAEHQFTTADRERLAKISRENGAKGGRPPKPKETHAGSKKTQGKPESESESGLDDSSKTYTSQSLDNRAREWTDSLSPAAEVLAKQAGLRDVPKLRSEIYERTGCDLTLDRTVGVARHFIEKSKQPVISGQAYFMRCVTDTPAEIEQHIYKGT